MVAICQCSLAGTVACRDCQYFNCTEHVAYWRALTVSKSHGWECPKCGRVNAPWVSECPCYREKGKPNPFEDTTTDGPPAVWRSSGEPPDMRYTDPMDGTRKTDAAGNRL